MIEGREEDAWREAMSLPDCASESGDCRRMWAACLPYPRCGAGRPGTTRSGRHGGPGSGLRGDVGNIRQAHIERALAWLERMLKNTWGVADNGESKSKFDPLRRQPRTKAVLTKLHLE
jgi:hypothetical protein